MGDELDKAWALELGFLTRVALHERRPDSSTLILLPEVSYAALLGAGRADHSLVVGLGIGKLYNGYVFGLVPGFVVGGFRPTNISTERETGMGMRTMLTVEILGGVGAQAGYQFHSINGQLVHEARMTLSLNALPVWIFRAMTSK